MAQIITDREIKELRHNFVSYYRDLSSPSDAFYLYKHGYQAEFLELLRMEDIHEFQSLAYDLLWEALSKFSRAKGKNISSYIKGITLLWKYKYNDTSPYVTYKHRSNRSNLPSAKAKESTQAEAGKQIPRPSCAEADRYLSQWNSDPAYYEPDEVLKKLFTQIQPQNTMIDAIILKVAALNTVYSTHINSVYPVAKHILSLDVDKRLCEGDENLVNEVMRVGYRSEEKIDHYSFATKYCSFHKPDAYPIYEAILKKS